MKQTIICYDEWQRLLSIFGERTEDKVFTRLPYEEWKMLRDGGGRGNDVHVTWGKADYNDAFYTIDIYLGKGTDLFLNFDSDDGTFGEFLYWYALDCDDDKWNDKVNTNDTKKENNDMKFNFNFGPANSDTVKMSLYGLAVKNKNNTWVSYDAKSGEIMDVDILNFNGAKYLYMLPVAMKDIAVGDVVIHNHIPMFVIGFSSDNKSITAIDPVAGERKEILLTKSPFGFNFATKVVNLLGNCFGECANADNPFGNMGLMMLLSDGGKDMNDLLPLMLLSGGKFDMSNPLMMYALLGNKGNNDMLPLLLLGSQGGFTFGSAGAAPTQTQN